MKHALLLLTAGILLSLTGMWWWMTRPVPEDASAVSSKAAPALIIAAPRPGASPGKAPVTPVPAAAPKALTPEQQQIEANKKIDRANLAKIRTGIFAYKTKYGRYPEYLTQLVPEFVTAETLVSPQKTPGARDHADLDHQDPGLARPSYGYEFSNLEFRDGRTFAEIKEVQRAEWGDAIPLLRCFAYGEVMNMAYGGEVYETALNWEWDAATMDVVEKYGWGPGLKVGETTRIRVLGADGQPVAGAEVWADGRNYSFDLPNRPFSTDRNGYATIPLGADLDRTALVLRAVAPGMASATFSYAPGQLPEGQSLSLAPVETLGGTALDAAGQPMANARVYLKTGAEGTSSATVTSVRTDEAGRWKAPVNPQDTANLSALIGIPNGIPVKHSSGQILDPAAARAGQAEVRAAAR